MYAEIYEDMASKNRHVDFIQGRWWFLPLDAMALVGILMIGNLKTSTGGEDKDNNRGIDGNASECKLGFVARRIYKVRNRTQHPTSWVQGVATQFHFTIRSLQAEHVLWVLVSDVADRHCWRDFHEVRRESTIEAANPVDLYRFHGDIADSRVRWRVKYSALGL